MIRPSFLKPEQFIDATDQLHKIAQNAGAFKRTIKAVVYPYSHSEVEAIAAWANSEKLCLYPISTGKNWGMGSKVPVTDNCIVVNLSRMNRIIELNTTHDYVVLEPGVTQEQLYNYLVDNNLPYIFNVTGSSPKTSIIGNSLERGVGYFSSRVENLRALQVVMGNGKTIHTGFSHYNQAKTKGVYSFGVGPDVSGLFFQSNVGITTQATFDLIPKREVHGIMLLGLTNASNYEAYIDDLAKLRKQEVITTAFHIANRNRSTIAIMPHVLTYFEQELGLPPNEAQVSATAFYNKISKDSWSAFGGIMGSMAEVQLAKKIITKRMKKYGKVMFLTASKLQNLNRLAAALAFIPYFKKLKAFTLSMESALSYSQGIPSDMALHSVYYPINKKLVNQDVEQIDGSEAGLQFSLPILPLAGKDLKTAADATVQIFSKHGFEAYITFNIIDSKSIESVINLAFDKTKTAETEKAFKAINELNEFFMQKGYILYRTDIDRMKQIVDEKDVFWQTVKELKQTLDPNNIIAPKRYNLQ